MFINLCMSEPFYIESQIFFYLIFFFGGGGGWQNILSHLFLGQKPVNLKL